MFGDQFFAELIFADLYGVGGGVGAIGPVDPPIPVDPPDEPDPWNPICPDPCIWSKTPVTCPGEKPEC